MARINPTLLSLLIGGAVLACAQTTAAQSARKSWVDPKSGIEFVRIDKACYRMGNDAALPPEPDSGWRRLNYKESLSADEGPVHEVCLDAYWLGRHEVTRKQWQQVMGSLPDGDLQAPGDLPVTGVTWPQANAFVERLTTLHGKGKRFRLPTEAEWEFACRGADPAAPALPATMTEGSVRQLAVADIQGPAAPSPVGSRPANAAGIFDLLGNVWEWTADDYAADAYRQHPLYNPQFRAGLDAAVLRGGSARTEWKQTRCTMRGRYPKAETLNLIGLRVVRED